MLKDLVDSVSTLFSTTSPTSSSSSPPSPSPSPGDRSAAPPPAGSAVGPDVVSERVAHKLKGYFELAKQLIDKAVRAEEWGLVDEAVANYQSANRVLLEGKGVRAPASLSSR